MGRISLWQTNTETDKAHYAAVEERFGELDWQVKMGTIYAKGASQSEVLASMQKQGFMYDHRYNAFYHTTVSDYVEALKDNARKLQGRLSHIVEVAKGNK